MFFLIYLTAGLVNPLVLAKFPDTASCSAALSVVRMVESEKTPLTHFCIAEADYTQYLTERTQQQFLLWQQDSSN